MAYKQRGVVELEGTDGRTYRLKFGTNAICKIEEKYNKGINEILESLTDGKALRVGTLRTMVQVSVQGGLSEEEVGDLIDDVGMQKIAQVFAAMFEQPQEGATPQSAGELTGASVS